MPENVKPAGKKAEKTVETTLGNPWGGCLSIGVYVLTLIYLIQQSVIMLTPNGPSTVYTSAGYALSTDQKNAPINLGQFNSSLNFIVGIRNTSFDLLNNEYVRVVPYLLN